MVRYYERYSAKMHMRDKPIKFDYTLLVCFMSSAYLYNFKKKLGQKWKIGKAIGSSCYHEPDFLNDPEKLEIHNLFFCDNFFTSHEIMCHLRELSMRATNTVRDNRSQKCPLNSSKPMQTKERGYLIIHLTNGIIINQCPLQLITVAANH